MDAFAREPVVRHHDRRAGAAGRGCLVLLRQGRGRVVRRLVERQQVEWTGRSPCEQWEKRASAEAAGTGDEQPVARTESPVGAGLPRAERQVGHTAPEPKDRRADRGRRGGRGGAPR
ncbi:hypothetical protein CP969_04385 [Streptomyces viridosporus T7A]|uniref:Integrase n=1 Tax=Streptomyces viridosporus T7A TaxID=665577 RepID=A0ABX6A8G1_STRVD|nr:hypothetical protein CP969_04385 [Streptomyces viridosporus T7A]